MARNRNSVRIASRKTTPLHRTRLMAKLAQWPSTDRKPIVEATYATEQKTSFRELRSTSNSDMVRAFRVVTTRSLARVETRRLTETTRLFISSRFRKPLLTIT